ncbi:MAG: serine--tRNA ligase [Cyclobacteriaceae bacterium]|nr:serine--tRNA ligase [Cyclobacteriaceae bacterium]
MLRIADIIENKDIVIAGLEKKKIHNAASILDDAIAIDQKRKTTQGALDDCLRQGNEMAKKIGLLIKEGKKEEAEAAKSHTAKLKESSKQLQEELKQIEKDLTDLLITLPNAAHISVPKGLSPDDNEVIIQKGEIPKLKENALPHWELIEKYDIIDFELGNKITGAGFPVYKGKGARLQRALINFFLDEAEKAGYKEIQPPIVVNAASGYGTGQLPDKEGMMYGITDSDFYLIPTAEVPITNLYRDVILNEDELPVKNAGYTPCFRREAGSWGAHVRGLNRLHQFDKVEIVQICKPEDSYTILEEMCQHVQGLLEALDLPYRKLRLCGGDMGFATALTYDMEVFSAAQEKWLEVSSVSNFENFQSNRLMLRYRDTDKKIRLAHTLNGSALALPRIVAAILENNQKEDGIQIPAALIPYTGFDKITAL